MFNPRSVSLMILGAVSLAQTHPAAAQDEVTLQQAQAECQSVAQQQSGYNPNATATTTQSQAGGRARSAAVGASRQRQDRRQERRTEKQQSGAADAFNQAYASCMSAKGFAGQ